MLVSIVIVSRNRSALLLRAVESCCTQDHSDVEILVFDDCSDDDTEAVMQPLKDRIRYFRSDVSHGYIIHRNAGFREARGEIVMSLDDDAFFVSATTISELVHAFQCSPDTTAFGLRYTEPRLTPQTRMAKVADMQRIRSFIGCAHAIRRQQALDAGGYDEQLVHQGEERDLCIRLLDQGHYVRYLHSSPIIHERAPRLNEMAVNYLGVRNTLYFDFRRTPLLLLLVFLPWDICRLFIYKLRQVGPVRRTQQILLSLKYCLSRIQDRSPVSIAGYIRFRCLPRHGAEYLPQIIEDHGIE